MFSMDHCRYRAAEKGLSLLELLAALFILGLLATLVPPALDSVGGGWKLRADARNVESVLRWAQNAAVADGVPAYVLYDVPKRTFWVRHREEPVSACQLSRDIRFEAVRMGTIRIVNDRARITAYPDGTVDAHQVVLSGRKGRRMSIRFDRLTGEAIYEETADASR